MARDKAKDDKYFNCSQSHELNYVAGLYADKEGVKDFLEKSCKSNAICNSTHKEVYELIKEKLDFPIPVSN